MADLGLLAALADAAVARALAIAKISRNELRLATVVSSDLLTTRTVTVIIDGDSAALPVQTAVPRSWYPVGSRVVIMLVPPSGPVIIGVVNGDHDPWHLITTLGAGWVVYGFGNNAPAYRREGDRVWLRGVIAGGTFGLGATIFTLPAGYWPPANVPLPALSNSAAGYLTVGPAGAVAAVSGSPVWFSLEGCSFSLIPPSPTS